MLTVVALTAVLASVPLEASCDHEQLSANLCAAAENREQQLDLEAWGTAPGSPPSSTDGARPNPSDVSLHDSTAAEQDCGPLNRCDNFTVSLLPQATIADVASFAPAPSALGGEPAGHGVVGLPTNFLVSAAEHTATGTLFDLPVTVRFVPERVILSPGDGSSLSVRGPGRSWSALGQAAFSPTDTSHTYTARGVYTATAVVQYRAEVDFGRGWRPVTGTLDIPTAGYTIEVLEVRSALVDRTCDEDPAGPGC